jgi:hypothetical protein
MNHVSHVNIKKVISQDSNVLQDSKENPVSTRKVRTIGNNVLQDNQENHVSTKRVRTIDHNVPQDNQESPVSLRKVRTIDHIVSQDSLVNTRKVRSQDHIVSQEKAVTHITEVITVVVKANQEAEEVAIVVAIEMVVINHSVEANEVETTKATKDKDVMMVTKEVAVPTALLEELQKTINLSTASSRRND